MATKFSKSETIQFNRGLMKKGGSTKAVKKAADGMAVKSAKATPKAQYGKTMMKKGGSTKKK
jgi:hypothetical protein